MALLTITEVKHTAARNRPWSFYMKNKKGQFWYATGRGLNEPVEICWGNPGMRPQSKLVLWTDMEAKIPELLSKGYTYINHPYIRMSAGSILKLSNPSLWPTTAPGSTQAPSWTAGAAQKALGHPWADIVCLRIIRKQTQVFGFEAVDTAGTVLLTMTMAEAKEFAREHDVPLEWR